MRTSRILHDPAGQSIEAAHPWPLGPATTCLMRGMPTRPAAALWRIAVAALPLLLGTPAPAAAQELSPQIQVDRLMVQADRQIASGQYGAALRTLDRILELQEEHDLEFPEPFWMKRAEVAVGAQDYLEAMASATRYLELAGREGEHYAAALDLLDGAIAVGCTPERMTATLASVQACLAAGADPNGAGRDGRTTLDWAAEREDPGITAALIAAGADPAVAAAAREADAAMSPGTVFRDDCAACPEMVVVPAGSFMMGSPESEEGRYDDEGTRHRVTIGSPFSVGVYEVTFAEWDACVRAGGCGGYRAEDEGWGRGSRPVINVSWEDAREYVRWLSRETGEEYRLLTEAEWEYVARAGTQTARYWGESESGQCRYGNGYDRTGHAELEFSWDPVSCSDGYVHTAPVGLFEPNAFGLYDVLGNVWEWTQDCWNDSYSGAPTDGSAWRSGDCSRRVLRGGSWGDAPGNLRSANRIWDSAGDRYNRLRIPCRPDHELTPTSLPLHLLHGGPGGSAPWSRHAAL